MPFSWTTFVETAVYAEGVEDCNPGAEEGYFITLRTSKVVFEMAASYP